MHNIPTRACDRRFHIFRMNTFFHNFPRTPSLSKFEKPLILSNRVFSKSPIALLRLLMYFYITLIETPNRYCQVNNSNDYS